MSDALDFDGPLDHIARARLPWRDDDLTECGKPGDSIAGQLVTREEVQRRVNKVGKQRAAFTVCMTCVDRIRYRQVTWEQSPAGVLWRELERCGGKMAHYEDEDRSDKLARINGELRAIAALIEAHPEEFQSYLDGLGETVSLEQARKSRRRARKPS